MDGMDKLKKKKMDAYMEGYIPEKKMREMFSKEAMDSAAKEKKKKIAADRLKSQTIRRGMEEKYHEQGKPSGGAYEQDAGSMKKWQGAKERVKPLLKSREEWEKKKKKVDEESQMGVKKTKGGLRYK